MNVSALSISSHKHTTLIKRAFCFLGFCPWVFFRVFLFVCFLDVWILYRFVFFYFEEGKAEETNAIKVL